MAEVKWIKLDVDTFDNRKIKHIRKLPEGDSIALIWVMLLTMAGRCNDGGRIYLTEIIPYTTKMLADEMDFEESTVVLALQAFERFGMIYKDGEHIVITGWEEHQNIEGMEKIREQNRERKRLQRERERRAQLDTSRDSHVTVTQGHAIEVDKDKEIDLFTTTTTADTHAHTREGVENSSEVSPPHLAEVLLFFKSDFCTDRCSADPLDEALKFIAYNEKRKWDCLPDWEATAELWAARIKDHSRSVR